VSVFCIFQPVSVLEMDGKVDVLDELIYVESALCSTGTKYYGELTEQMVKNKEAPVRYRCYIYIYICTYIYM